MSDPWSEDERLAAFLDGRMDAREREEMKAHLLDHDEDLEVLAGAAAILSQMEEAEAPSGVISLDAAKREREARTEPEGARRTTGSQVVRWLAFAAVLVGLALVTGRVLSRPSPYDPVRLAARVERPGQRLPSDWNEQAPWSASRGPDTARGGTPREQVARGARAGVMLVDLSLRVGEQNAERTIDIARQLRRFDPTGGRRGPLQQIEAGAGSPPAQLRPLVARAGERIGDRVDRDGMQLGAWIEAARVAAARHDAAFFRDAAATAEMLDRATRITGGDPRVRTAVERVRGLIADPPPWDALSPALEELLGAVASG